MTEKIVVADPCYSEENFRKLLEELFGARNQCQDDSREWEIMTRIMFDILIDMSPMERLHIEICGTFSSGLVENTSTKEDFNKLRLYQRTPWSALDVLDGKRGYILDSKSTPIQYKLSWKEVKNVLFLDPPDELVDHYSTPGLRWIARWRLKCYEEFIDRENREVREG